MEEPCEPEKVRLPACPRNPETTSLERPAGGQRDRARMRRPKPQAHSEITADLRCAPFPLQKHSGRTHHFKLHA